jgi:hypothetical protein
MKNLRHLEVFETFAVNEYYTHPHMQGYTMHGNKENQEGSGFVVGDKAEYDFKNTKTGEVVQSMPVEIVEVYKDDNGNYVVVGKSEGGTSWVFGTDDNKFHSLDDLRKI